MSDANDVKFSLKVVINKQKTKVLYAEADSDFTDVVLSFLTLPLGTIVRILGKHYGGEAPVVGSLTTLYNSLSNLNSDLFCTESGKQMLLNPRKSLDNERCKLKLNVDDTPLTKSFKCADIDCSSKKTQNTGLYYGTSKCDCGKSALSIDLGVLEYDNPIKEDDGDCGIYTRSTASFIITDDLQIFPSETGYAIRILISQGITSTDGTELRDVTFGFNEVMDLLKGSLLSQTPLTDLILNKGKLNSAVKRDMCILPVNQTDKQSSSNDKKMTVKAIIQESTNRLLLVEADGDFVDFLFTLFTIPLGAVECLLGNKTTLKNIDNLYRSLENIADDKYIKTQDTEMMLLEPELPTGYVSKDKILPLIEESIDIFGGDDQWVSSVKSPKGPGNYVKGQKMYIVNDDLTVTPLSTASSLSIINQHKVPLSDIKELKLDIGLNEALSILKASLTSTSALSDGLKIKPSTRKKPKKEHP